VMARRLIVAIALAIIMAFGLCACGQQSTSSQPTSQSSGTFKTMADVFSAKSSEVRWVYDESHFFYAFNNDGKYTRVVVDLPNGMKDKLDASNFDEAKIKELLGSLPIAKSEVLADAATVQKELDALKGKTGAEVSAAGYVINNYVVNGKTTDCSAEKQSLAYLITFDGAVDKNTLSPTEAVEDLKVKSASIQGVSASALGLGEK
ncbi:MAG: hypothetical protein Q4D34_06865, partial [Eggerthellaceae bacterium]|nr:hypothetical protein [Eggerthellaceae bacterium]